MWRNSACLMLINGPFKYKRSILDPGSILEKRVLPDCLEIIDHPESTDKELLFVRRHAKSGFMVIYDLDSKTGGSIRFFSPEAESTPHVSSGQLYDIAPPTF